MRPVSAALFQLQLALSTVAVLLARPHGRHAVSPRHRLARATWHPIRTVALTAVAAIGGLFVVSAIVGSAFAGDPSTPPTPAVAKYVAIYAGQPSDPTLAGIAGPVAAPPHRAAPVSRAARTADEVVGQYHLPIGKRVCFQDNGWNRWNDVLPGIAWRLRTHGIDAVVWDDCSSQPAAQTVVLAVSNSPDEFYCGRTERGGYYSDGTAAGRTVIRINLAASWYSQCLATWGQRVHVMSHESGHVFGLVHRPGDLASVMYAGDNNPYLPWYGAPDYADLTNIYTKGKR